MKKNGFISMTMVYTFLVLFLFLMLAVLNAYTQKNKFLQAINDKINLTIDTPNKYDYCSYSSGQIWDFNYTGNEQTFIVECSGKYKIELWGAQGGKKGTTAAVIAGYGAYTSGEINLEKGTRLYVYVGQKPTNYFTSCNDANNNYAFNGNIGGSCVGGGGATDVRLEGGQWSYPKSLRSRIMVAGGGGGAYYSGSGGSAGGLIGYTATGGTGESGSGGRQSSNSFGIGVNLNATSSGGGGYYGGEGGISSNGGGGSSFISGHKGCIASSSVLTTTPRLDSNGNQCTEGTSDIVCSYHYSGKIFENTVMIDGTGYAWTDAKGSVQQMPSPDGTTIIQSGNTGDGHAKITFLSE